MDGYKRVIDYIIEQADRYDLQNMRSEDDTISRILQIYDRMQSEILRAADIYGGITTLLQMQKLISKIEDITRKYYSDMLSILSSAASEHTDISYTQFGDLIELGLGVESKARSQGLLEIQKKNKMIDNNMIDYMQNHVMERVKWLDTSLIDKVRSSLGELILQNDVSKASVRARLTEILGTSRSKAEEIAQTELSMAYNTGAISRMNEYNTQNPGQPVMKYWHGFKYSQTTCTFCRPKIGTIYNSDDNTYYLPAHPRCRCVWLPMMSGWDKPISSIFTRRANMLSRIYTPDDIYARINMRLGISYGKYIPLDAATKYLEGERTPNIQKAIVDARSNAVNDTVSAFDIALSNSKKNMEREFNIQMKFWKDYVAGNIVDGNKDVLSRSYEAIKGVMILPWDATQLEGWNKLLGIISKNI